MNSIKLFLFNTLIIIFSCIVGVAFIELIWYVYSYPTKNSPSRYFLTHGSNGVFESNKNLVIYKQNSNITHQVWIKNNNEYLNEFKYSFKTNNIGLVQNNNIQKNIKSILFLGDSFTEGVGSEPWFYLLDQHYRNNNIQLINGGILGTGFLHWKALEKYLSSESYIISSLVVIYISDDFYRKQWNFSDGILKCTDNYLNCAGWEQFLGTPPQGKEINFLRYIDNKKVSGNFSEFNFKEFIKSKMHASTEIYRYILRIYSKYESLRVVANLIDKYKSQIIFIHLPSREEVLENKNNGIIYNNYIERLGGKAFNGHNLCNLNSDDFYQFDGHPNKSGYEKIRHCVFKIIDKELM